MFCDTLQQAGGAGGLSCPETRASLLTGHLCVEGEASVPAPRLALEDLSPSPSKPPTQCLALGKVPFDFHSVFTDWDVSGTPK